jgi:hypothetical protein
VKEVYKQEDASYASASKVVELTMARPALMSLTDGRRIGSRNDCYRNQSALRGRLEITFENRRDWTLADLTCLILRKILCRHWTSTS